MKKSSLLWLSALSVIFLSYPLLAQEKNHYSSDLIEQVEHFAKASSFSQTYGPERFGSEGHMYKESAQHYPPGKYGPGGHGTENEGYMGKESEHYPPGKYGPGGHGTENEGY